MFRTKPFFLSLVFLMAFFWIGCQGGDTVEHTDSNLVFFKDKLYYKRNLFTGILKTDVSALGETQTARYKDGLEDGEFLSVNKDGRVLERRFFREGLKEGVHRAWFPNGNNRFYSEFRSGKYVNDRWEWYENGKPSLYEKFDENGKLIVVKKWNRNGQIYMNTVIAADGSSLGLPGSKICEPIKKAD
ncbi:toxin-antitoxin system YwqK family antitoxin [Leptospira sanjuanensis]|uniref:toxin-antitoxin system YwqK family antitoxin n=1 Tax=Leptospira sanjuanensis TaxID=2879643 RepID=UPI001EE99904|nr:hypothetical protein [Leptospira sanjuanensis]MCG6166731.1 hypothetical protein [Leptospira sanjuanensis]